MWALDISIILLFKPSSDIFHYQNSNKRSHDQEKGDGPHDKGSAPSVFGSDSEIVPIDLLWHTSLFYL